MAKKAPNPPTADTREQETTTTVRVLCAALGEDSNTYLKGETFTTTAARAAALGGSVEIL